MQYSDLISARVTISMDAPGMVMANGPQASNTTTENFIYSSLRWMKEDLSVLPQKQKVPGKLRNNPGDFMFQAYSLMTTEEFMYRTVTALIK